ncbi:hypothetical protein C8J56DRAFT_846398 [Mycena floridula]|nr:hypothetical protein C8J56DRAFT_846398 [Mycena floridula]
MSFARACLVGIQAIANFLAFIPPNPTPDKGRYHTNQLYVLQIAPLIFKIHDLGLRLCAVFETLTYFEMLLSPSSTSFICPSGRIRITPLFIVGVLAVLFGSWIRIHCFKTLGKLFTFDLTVHPEHRLITSGMYSYVRHPAYTGSMLNVAGLSLSHLSRGSWMTECGPLRAGSSAAVVWAVWWIWTLSVGVSRAKAEDEQMKQLFGKEWEKYAEKVQWWFCPGLL